MEGVEARGQGEGVMVQDTLHQALIPLMLPQMLSQLMVEIKMSTRSVVPLKYIIKN